MRSLSPPRKPKAPPKSFDFSQYSTRLIALKFAYLGSVYNGYEHHQNNTTPLPTVEEELWKALVKTRLIFPDDDKTVGDWTRADYSKCGRTDRGVSALGQVIGVRVRSSKPLPKPKPALVSEDKQPHPVESAEAPDANQNGNGVEGIPAGPEDPEPEDQEPKWDPIEDELPYIQLINRVLPPAIRILAWCPNPGEDFSARFSCRERRYKYFFTQPAFCPADPSNPTSPGWLDIPKMQKAAKMYEGLHDFRNLCKVDPSKQITNFERRIFHCSVDPVAPLTTPAFMPEGAAQPMLYAFSVHGSAFLWHQVRHLVGVLFLIGQGLEKPELIEELMDVEKNPRRPMYDMADDKPLVLWDCLFPKLAESEEGGRGERLTESRPDSLGWIYSDEDAKWGRGALMEDLWRGWRSRMMEEIVAGQLMDTAARQANKVTATIEEKDKNTRTKGRRGKESTQVFEGGDGPRLKGTYIPILRRERMATVEEINERYRQRKGIPEGIKKTADDGDE